MQPHEFSQKEEVGTWNLAPIGQTRKVFLVNNNKTIFVSRVHRRQRKRLEIFMYENCRFFYFSFFSIFTIGNNRLRQIFLIKGWRCWITGLGSFVSELSPWQVLFENDPNGRQNGKKIRLFCFLQNCACWLVEFFFLSNSKCRLSRSIFSYFSFEKKENKANREKMVSHSL